MDDKTTRQVQVAVSYRPKADKEQVQAGHGRSLRAVIYARVSTQEQAQRKTSIPDQLDICRKAISEKGWCFVDEFRDEGVSGHLTEERAGLQAMLRGAREHRLDLIVVKSYDRFARNKDSAAIIRQELKELGVQTFAVTTPVDPKSPGEYDPNEDDLGTIVETISDMQADLERKQIARRMKMGKLIKAKSGTIPNRVPYGYRIIRALEGSKVQRTVVPSEEEAARVRFIFESYSKGMGDRKITIELNRKGWKSPKGSKWTLATVKYILMNPTYSGKVWWGWRHASYRKTKEWRLRGKLGYTGKGLHQPIIDENLFGVVQEIRAGRQRANRGGAARSLGLLTGIAKCIRCGSGVGYQKRLHNRSKEHSEWRDTITYEYICTGYKYSGICSPRVMSAIKLEAAVLDHVKNLYNHPKVQERIVHEGNDSEEAATQKQLEHLEREIGMAPVKMQRQHDAYERGIISMDEYEANLSRIREETAKNHMDKDRIVAQSSLASQKLSAMEQLIASFKDFDTSWSKMTLDEKKLILRSIIREIRAGSGRVEIDFIL